MTNCTFRKKFIHLGNQHLCKMEKAAIKAAILQSLSEEIDIWLDKQEKITDGYEYESVFMATAQKVNKILLSKSMGKLPGSRNKKNSTPVLGRSK